MRRRSQAVSPPSTNVEEAGVDSRKEGKGEEKSRRACLHAQLRKTKLCMYYVKGICQYGNQCAFAHSCVELHDSPDLRKTRLCKAFAEGGCTDPDCGFAHGKEELRSTNMFYKKTLCIWHEKDKCRNGNNCRFAHGIDELRPSGLERSAPFRDGQPTAGSAAGSNHKKAVSTGEVSTTEGSVESRSGSNSAGSSSNKMCVREQPRRGGRRRGVKTSDPVENLRRGASSPGRVRSTPMPAAGSGAAPAFSTAIESDRSSRVVEPMKVHPLTSLPQVAMPGNLGPGAVFHAGPPMDADNNALRADLQRLHQEISLLTAKCSQMQQMVSPYAAVGYPPYTPAAFGTAEDYLSTMAPELLRARNTNLMAPTLLPASLQENPHVNAGWPADLSPNGPHMQA